MRRQFLIGVAFGCGLSAAVWISLSYFYKTTMIVDNNDEYLVLGEPSLDDENRSEGLAFSHEAGAIMHGCGAWYFESQAVDEAIAGQAALPIIAKNFDAIECIILAANDAQVSVQFETRNSPNMEEILRSKNAQAPREQ